MRVLKGVERFAEYIRTESRVRNNYDNHRRCNQTEYAADAADAGAAA
jgi:hypothetical protein